jgi:4,5-dihydroxyphthalate decarboxylase
MTPRSLPAKLSRMLTLRAGFSPNPRLAPLLSGEVKVDGVELQFEFGSPGVMFHRHLKDDDFDVFEFSLSDYLIAQERATSDRWSWTGIPIFLSKAFPFLGTQVHRSAEIAGPSDLVGKKFGVPDFTMTAALWLRAMLKELYGTSAHDIEWFNGRTPNTSHAALLGIDKEPPPGIDIHFLQREGQMLQMLQQGEIHAGWGESPQQAEFEERSELRPLFEDGGRRFIGEFFSKARFVPPNHVVVMQKRLVEKEPWLPEALYEAFEQSKQEAYRRARAAQAAYMIFAGEDFDRQAQMFGPDPFPSGLRANRRMLTMAAAQSWEEGLTSTPAEPEDLFAESVRET